MIRRITSPDDAALDALCAELASRAGEVDRAGAWPAEQLRLLGEAGVYEWFVPVEHGGQGWSEEALVRGYVAMAAACLTTTFVLTQRVGACKRIVASENAALTKRLIPGLLSGAEFATVGVSHLTTSRQHLGRPALAARRVSGGWRLDGAAPWVTGGEHADTVVLGASVVEEGVEGDAATGDEMLLAVPRAQPGVTAPPGFVMVALSASKTGPVEVSGVFVPDADVVAGPVPRVMQTGVGARPGGPQTSAVAVGAASASVNLLRAEAAKRPDLAAATDALGAELAEVYADLLAAARGTPTCSSESLRQRANSLVLRASQASLTATKGAGYLASASAGRYCREALFFLVWSCPAPVQNANLCELAGLS
jgi:alkylation response protein AidB-like acyl-CoA dehydrogenase